MVVGWVDSSLTKYLVSTTRAAEPQPKLKIHELTRNNTKSSFGDLAFVIIRVIWGIVMFAQITRSFAIASKITSISLGTRFEPKRSKVNLRNLWMLISNSPLNWSYPLVPLNQIGQEATLDSSHPLRQNRATSKAELP
jgi:hypothetical protein